MKSLSQMTEEELKTLCKTLEERYGENSTITIKQSDFNNMWASIDRYAKENKRLQEQLEEAIKTAKDQELIIKKLKRRRICDNKKTEARKEHINELIDDIKKLKEEIARRGRIINELKTQRKEANDILIKSQNMKQPDRNNFVAQYLLKWGVK